MIAELGHEHEAVKSQIALLNAAITDLEQNLEQNRERQAYLEKLLANIQNATDPDAPIQ